MDIRVGTFNLNNLFSRFNLYTEADPQIRSAAEEATEENPRQWLESAEGESTEQEELEVVSPAARSAQMASCIGSASSKAS